MAQMYFNPNATNTGARFVIWRAHGIFMTYDPDTKRIMGWINGSIRKMKFVAEVPAIHRTHMPLSSEIIDAYDAAIKEFTDKRKHLTKE